MKTVELPGMVVRTVSVGTMDNNVYLLTAADGEQVLIDPAAEPDQVEAMLLAARADAEQPVLRYVAITHHHYDHIGALASIMATHPDAVAVAGAADADAITQATGVPIGRHLEHGDTLTIGGIELAVIALRGHTPGSVTLACSRPPAPTQLFTGDSLFPGGVGRTESSADFSSLYADVVSRLFEAYPDDTVVWPGHGLRTTLGLERPQLAEWRERGW